MGVLHQLLLFTALAAHAATFGHDIIHGRKAESGSLGYMASVQINGTHVCGGFLIAPSFVLTAAHCDKSGKMTVVLGRHSIKGNVRRHEVQSRIKHKSFNTTVTGNDIMLLKLSKNVKLGKGVNVIKIPRNDKTVKSPTNCLVAGWGFTEKNKKATDDLLVVNVTTIDMKECRNVWQETRVTLPANVICAGGYETEAGACQGDSGGPLVCNNEAVGIVSFNLRNNCHYPNVPNVYTQISKFLRWIKKHMKVHSSA